MHDPEFTKSLSLELSRELACDIQIKESKALHGGSVNASFRLETNEGSFFIKTNSKSQFPGLFEQEKAGLETLAEHSNFEIPEVILCSDIGDKAFLLLDYIEQGTAQASTWNDFGWNLAKLHQNQSRQFGFQEDNYMGSLLQKNNRCDLWADFFGEFRLRAQAKLAFDSDRIDARTLGQIEGLIEKLKDLFPVESASLLHGDLWSGNFLFNTAGKTVLIDPAVYYGHREMDLAMSYLFGGFHADMYRAYQEVFPLEKNWEERIDLCNLYPLLVHVNLFGSSYSSRLKSTLKKFI